MAFTQRQTQIIINTVRSIHNAQAIVKQLESIGLNCESDKSRNTIGHSVYGMLDMLTKTFCMTCDIFIDFNMTAEEQPTNSENETNTENLMNELLDFASRDDISDTDIIKFATNAKERTICAAKEGR